MNGSEKQIEWAIKIKDQITSIYKTFQQTNDLTEEEICAYNALMTITDAKFWIEDCRFKQQEFEWLVYKAKQKALIK